MRKLFLLSGLVLLLAISCRKDEIDPYSGNDNSICFAAQSVSFSFRGMTEDKKTFIIPLTLIGHVVDYDREVTVKVLDSEKNTAVENTDFVLKKAMVKAGATKGELEIEINNLSLDKERLCVYLEIIPNSHFKTGYVKYMSALVEWSKTFVRPANENVWFLWYSYFSKCYSKAYHEFVVQTLGDEVDRAVASPSHLVEGEDLVYWPVDIWYASVRKLRQAVIDYDQKHPDAPLRHSSDYESYKSSAVPVGEGQKYTGDLPPTIIETLN